MFRAQSSAAHQNCNCFIRALSVHLFKRTEHLFCSFEQVLVAGLISILQNIKSIPQLLGIKTVIPSSGMSVSV